tara:strand:- start:46 stop:639 length:594 start_codon:yes stop_codon:yes gene_type:complete
MAYPIIKYRLRADGRQPEYLAGISTGFSGECSVNTNVVGKIPRWLSPQENVYLGLAVGPADPAGLPSGCEGTIDSKSDLTTYITSISGSWTVDTEVTVGVSTYREVGLTTCFDSVGNPSAAGITTTVIGTTTTSAGAGTTVGVNTYTSYSDSVTIVDGVSTTTKTHTTTTQNTMQNPYDAAAKATQLWDIYEAVNGL